MLEVLVLAVGLAMDSTAVAITLGLVAGELRARDVLRVGGVFGLVQAALPLVGALLAAQVGAALDAIDHVVALLVLGGLGVKMLRGGGEPETPGGAAARDPLALSAVLALAIATSIDAFFAGITLPLLAVPVYVAALAIGLVTLTLAGGGLWFGQRIGERAAGRLDKLGGLILIALGVKIFVAHQFFA